MDVSVPLMSIEELAGRAGVRVRTVRYYVAEGLLPGPGARGRAAVYGEEHLLRLQLIRRLAERHVPLAEMRARLAHLSLDEIRALLASEDRRAATLAGAATAGAAGDYIEALLRQEARHIAEAPPTPAAPAAPPALGERTSEVWRRWLLAPGVELHVRDDAGARHARLIRRLHRAAIEESEEVDVPPSPDGDSSLDQA